MNSAPAELLQLLTFAALQPSSVPPCLISQLVAKSEFGHIVFDAVRFTRLASRSPSHVASNKKPPCLKKFEHGGRQKRCGFVHIRVNLYPCFASLCGVALVKKTPHTTTRIFNLLNYTKTLMLRNRHDSFSSPFLHDRRASAPSMRKAC